MPITRRRMIILFAFLTTWGLVVCIRLFQKQILQHDHYVQKASRQHQRTVSLTPVRGSVLDSRGRILAESIRAESIYADPQAIVDAPSAAARLAAIPGIGLTKKELTKKLHGRGEFVWIARQVDAPTAAALKHLGIAGIYTLEEHRRTYPKHSLAANVLGYVNVDGEGLAGVEHSLDHYVRGRAGKVTLLRDARRGMYLVGGQGNNAPVDGSDVVLTIDEVIQFIAERALASTVAQYRATSGSVIVMDPRDGSILAMASYPTFDPNEARKSTPDAWRNRPVQDLYEPGSTFKIVTAAAGLQEGVVTPSQILDCGPGYIEIARTRIREHGGNAYGFIPFEEVLVHSSNVGTIRVGLALGQRRLYDYIRKFGFGERSGIDLPGEASGIVRPTEKWSQLSNAVISIGQEIGVTPLQILLAASTIANGGELVHPRLVDRIVDSEGRTISRPPIEKPRRVVTERTSAVLNELLKSVVKRGTGQNAALIEHVVAGKTGTAQKAFRGGYSADKFISSFVGYVPADRPRLAIIVVIDEPHGAHYGGTVAAPAFREIADATLRYLGVPASAPDRALEVAPTKLAMFSQSAAPAMNIPVSDRNGVVPDLRGLDARSAVARATRAGMQVRAFGTGRVVYQNPAPGGRSAGSIDLLFAAAEDAR